MKGLLASLFGSRFWLTSYAALMLGFAVPAGWLPYGLMQSLVPIFLGGILFFSGLRLPLLEMYDALRDRSLFVQTCALVPVKLLLIPVLAYGLALLLVPSWAGGVLLVSLVPMGLSSIAFTDLYGGQRMMAVSLVVATSVLAPLSIPLLLATAGHGSADGFPIAVLVERTLYILLLLLVPLILAQICRRLFMQAVRRHYQAWNGWAIACSCLLIFSSLSGTRPWWEDLSWWMLLHGGLAALLASAVALGVSLAACRALPPGRGLAMVMGSVYMNTGLGVAFALRFFPGDASVLLPCLLMQFPMVAATALAGQWIARHAGVQPPTPGGVGR